MRIGLGQHLQLRQGLELHAKVKLIQEARLLALTTLELQVDIRTVLEENPFLELDEDEREREEAELEGEESPNSDDAELIDWVSEAIERGNYQEEYPQQYANEERFDPLTLATRPSDIRDHLTREYVLEYGLSGELDPDSPDLGERWLLETLIGNLDKRGFISHEDLEAVIQAESPDDPEAVQLVRQRLQLIFPAGCGSVDLQDCFYAQLKWIEKQKGMCTALHRDILSAHWQDLEKQKYARIARLLKAAKSEIREAVDFMRSSLYASPVAIFEMDHGGGARTEFIEPDVFLSFDDDGEIVIDLRDDGYPKLRINQKYFEAFRQSEKNDGRKYSEEEKQNLRNYMSRAKLYIENIYSRMNTMQSIIEYLVVHQREFIITGDPKDIKPLTRSELAVDIGRDPSTVGRALSNKYVQFPSRDIVSFADFFQANLSVKEVLKEIVGGEERKKPFSDEKLAEELDKRGFSVARRTIAKYRREAGIPPAHRRKLH